MADNKTNILITATDQTAAAFNSVRNGLQGIDSAAGRTIVNFRSLGVTMAAGAFVSFIKANIDAADAMNDLAQRTGVGIKQLAGYKLAAEQSGASLESVARGIKAFSTYAAENGDTLKRLGIDTKDADKAMVSLAGIVSQLPDGMEKSALMTKLFGKAGQDLIPMLNMGSEGLAAAKKEAEEYGKQMEKLAPRADEFNDRLETMGIHAKAFGINVANEVIDGVLKIKNALEAEVKIKPGSIAYYLLGNPMADPGVRSGQQIWDAQRRAAGGGSQSQEITPEQAQEKARILADKGEAAEKRRTAAIKERNAAEKAWLDLQVEGIKNNADRLRGITEQTEQLELEIATYGQGKDAIELVTIARLEESRAIVAAKGATAGQLADLDAEIAARKRLASALGQKEALDANKKAADDARREWEKVTDDINRSLTDAIMDGGKGGAEMLQDYFRTLVLRPIISAVMAPVSQTVAGMFGGGGVPGASGGGFGGGMSGNPFQSWMGSSMGYGIADAAQWLSSGSAVGPAAPGSIGSLFSGAGQYANWQYGLAGLGGGLLGGMIGGEMGGTLGGIGSTLGMAMGGPVGALIGSIGGGALGSLFGGSGEDPHNNPDTQFIDLMLSRAGIGARAVQNGQVGNVVMGQTSGAGRWAEWTGFNDAQRSALTGGSSAMFTRGAELAKLFGTNAAGVASATAEGQFASIEAALASLGDAIALKVLPSIKDFQQASETLGQTAERLAQEFALTDQIAAMMGKSAASAIGGVGNRDSLVQLLGGMNNAGAAVGSYYQNYYSEAERQKAAQSSISNTLRGLGINNAPTDREGYRALVEAQDLTTESGRKMYASLISISSAFAGITQQATAAANALNPDRFSTTTEYRLAQAQLGAGLPVNLPSFDVGSNYVPYDMTANVHGGERIFTAIENRDIIERMNSGSSDGLLREIRALAAEVKALRTDNSRENVAANLHLLEIGRHARRLDEDGVVVRSVGQDGNPQIVQVEVVA